MPIKVYGLQPPNETFPKRLQNDSGCANNVPMITTAEAAQQLGVDVAKFHRLVAKHRIDPARKLPGIRGAMLWNPDDIATITEVAQ
jgi:hypothetical protein